MARWNISVPDDLRQEWDQYRHTAGLNVSELFRERVLLPELARGRAEAARRFRNGEEPDFAGRW